MPNCPFNYACSDDINNKQKLAPQYSPEVVHPNAPLDCRNLCEQLLVWMSIDDLSDSCLRFSVTCSLTCRELFGSIRLPENPHLGIHLFTQVIPLLVFIVVDLAVLRVASARDNVKRNTIMSFIQSLCVAECKRPVSYRPSQRFPKATSL